MYSHLISPGCLVSNPGACNFDCHFSTRSRKEARLQTKVSHHKLKVRSSKTGSIVNPDMKCISNDQRCQGLGPFLLCIRHVLYSVDYQYAD